MSTMITLWRSMPPAFILCPSSKNSLRTPSLAHSLLSCNLLRKQSRSSPRSLAFSLPRSSISGESSTSPPRRIEELIERDWSFLDVDSINSDEERRQKTHRILFAAGMCEGYRILVCMGSAWFVNCLVESAPSCELILVIHESLLALAMIKEEHDNVRCWQGEITALPKRFSLFDVLFVCYFPGMGVSLDQLLSSASNCCSPGGRVLISFEQGKGIIEGSHRRQHPDVVKFELPERSALEKAAAGHFFQIIEFVDEPTFYLAVLTFIGP